MTAQCRKARSGTLGGQVPDRSDARQEEVRSALHGDEAGKPPQSGPHRLGLDGERVPGSAACADQWIRIVVEAGELRVVDPCVVNELELAGQVGIETNEVQPSI